jgi:hydrogenase nickel incorporation protein HypA/HybF
VVWFGESLDPRVLDACFTASAAAQVMLVVGTSGVVYPAAPGGDMLKAQYDFPSLEGSILHEMSIARSLLDIVLEEAGRNGLSRVTSVSVRVGALVAVVPESLEFCFEVLTEDTVAAGAELHLEEVGAPARCAVCGLEFEARSALVLCPECEEPALVDPERGRELMLTGIEGETGEEHE